MKKTLLFLTLINFTITQSQIVNIPDNNFKTKLLEANPSNSIAYDINGNQIRIDINLDNQIQNSEVLNVYKLYVDHSFISDLTGIEVFTNLTDFSCSYNQIDSLDLNSQPNLITLDCSFNQLNNLDFSNLTLTYLRCNNNQFNSLNFGNQTNLYFLYCYDNQLNILDLSNQTNLTQLYCDINQLSSLDLSSQTNLNYLGCGDNPNLAYINLKNGNNENLFIDINSNFQNLPNLQSVCVDELNTGLTNFILSEVGHSVTFSTDCSALNITDNKILNFSVYPTPTENILNIKSKTEITKIEIYSKLGQLIKETTENKIDVSNLTQGLYFVKVEDINGNFGGKKIVKK